MVCKNAGFCGNIGRSLTLVMVSGGRIFPMRIGAVGKWQKTTLAIVAVIAVLIGIALSTRGVVAALLDDEHICRGVYVDGIDVGGLAISEARVRLEGRVREYEESPILVKRGDNIWRVIPGDLGVRVELEAALRAAYSLGRYGVFWNRITERLSIARSGRNIPWTVTVDEQLLRDFVFALAQQVQVAPVDARIVVHEDDSVSIEPSSDGCILNAAAFIGALRQATTARPPREFEMPVSCMPADVTTASLEAKGIRRLISKYTTRFDAGNTRRVNNIRLGAQQLDNKMLAPGEVMSFNDVVGPRIPERGFMEADIIFDSQLVPGIGGGICQVSTTLYNAAILGLLEPVARVNHSLPISYVPMGRDATVSYGTIDLKLKNASSSHILIRSYVGRDSITFKVFGDMPDNMGVSIHTEVIERLEPGAIQRVDPLAEPGSVTVQQDGKFGYVVAVWRITKVDGEEVERELMSRDRYKPQPKVLVVGPAATPTASQSESVTSELEPSPTVNSVQD
jgi:vancomycin resistance protein YoaR